jgi:hypothetical protein
VHVKSDLRLRMSNSQQQQALDHGYGDRLEGGSGEGFASGYIA